VKFGGLVAVDRVSAAFAAGELVGIIGPNGAGKTTFFNAISGVIATHQRRAAIAGQRLTGAQSAAPLRRWAWPAPSRPRACLPTERARPTSTFGLKFAAAATEMDLVGRRAGRAVGSSKDARRASSP
jgi:branched-chain amino acid transport system ATP-binding protein